MFLERRKKDKCQLLKEVTLGIIWIRIRGETFIVEFFL